MSSGVLVSFVIPAHDEERLIGATVAAIHEAAHAAGLRHAHTEPATEPTKDRAYEIVVAADACRDATAQIARSHGCTVTEVDHRQISKTRNSGAAHAKGRWLIFVDADTLVPAEAVRETLAAFESGAVGGGAGVQFDGQVPLWSRMVLSPTLAAFRLLRWTGGCYLFCTRQAFDAAGGWDETLFASEELTMCQRLKSQQGRQRVVIIKTPVLTSGRKLRAYSGWEVLSRVVPILLKGRKGVQKREGLDIWYARRDEPGKPGDRGAVITESGSIGNAKCTQDQ